HPVRILPDGKAIGRLLLVDLSLIGREHKRHAPSRDIVQWRSPFHGNIGIDAVETQVIAPTIGGDGEVNALTAELDAIGDIDIIKTPQGILWAWCGWRWDRLHFVASQGIHT